MSWYYVGEGLSNLVVSESRLQFVRRRLEYYKWYAATSVISGVGLGFYSWLGDKLVKKDVEFAKRRGGQLSSAPRLDDSIKSRNPGAYTSLKGGTNLGQK
ncbi:hypothetical protein DPMN_084918 [Dreissena polymorpha]|uniref:Uncharacterized protein n=1 Tax=Dreissena polymorpha TaxID=45954 RepID=A0A9D4BJQ7_DREPO|nr:hypothetical protein DPMN_084918 [Dreissena polymorpha]